jgi:porin
MLFGAVMAISSIARGQEPPLAGEPSACDSIESAGDASQPMCDCLWCRPKLTNDWGGRRTALAAQGFTYDMYLTQFFQDVATGGREQDGEYGGKLDYLPSLDAGKLGLQEGLFVNVHAETRYGASVNKIDGLLTPSNIAMNFPNKEKNLSALTGFKVTQALSESFVVYAGKINTLDEYPLRYNGGPGLGGFMNTSLVFNPIAARTVVYSAAGVGFAVLSNLEPVFTCSIFDPEERATKGLEGLFSRGFVIVPNFTFGVKPGGMPGKYNFGGTYSNAKYRSVDPDAYLDFPIAPGTFPTETGSWSLYSNFYQSIWVEDQNPKRAWGLFGQFGISDGNPNPVRFVANGGVGGASPLPERTLDTFGLGYFYIGLSQNFKSLAAPILPQQDEYGVEYFYNYAVTPWSRFTADLQVARPSTVGLKTAVIPGIRWQVIF